MLFVSSRKMKQIDSLATKKFGIPSLILMENAGRSVAEEAQKMLKCNSDFIAIFCGYGNNGGDGFVAARHLVNKGYKVKVFLIGPKKERSPDTKLNFEIIKKMKVVIEKIINEKYILAAFKNFKRPQLVIDAIFGIGIKGKLNNFYCQLFNKINNLNSLILAIDIPSGLDADRGIALPVAIKADKTVTMGSPKKGFLSSSAKEYLGKVIIADISLPKQIR